MTNFEKPDVVTILEGLINSLSSSKTNTRSRGFIDEYESGFYRGRAAAEENLAGELEPLLPDLKKLYTDALKWRRHVESNGDHSHRCKRCSLNYTPMPTESEDCPACGFDGVGD